LALARRNRQASWRLHLTPARPRANLKAHGPNTITLLVFPRRITALSGAYGLRSGSGSLAKFTASRASSSDSQAHRHLPLRLAFRKSLTIQGVVGSKIYSNGVGLPYATRPLCDAVIDRCRCDRGMCNAAAGRHRVRAERNQKFDRATAGGAGVN
jgi:hypothetical protein